VKKKKRENETTGDLELYLVLGSEEWNPTVCFFNPIYTYLCPRNNLVFGAWVSQK
jgi:hypothetical protein